MIRNGEIYFYLKDEAHGWLSNFYPSKFKYSGTVMPTNEHFYQSQKAAMIEFENWIAQAPNPYHAMLAGRNLRAKKGERHGDWDSRKLEVMREGLRRKFAIPDLRAKLLATRDMPIHEDNPTDMFWGVKGEDWLGKLLMQVRSEIYASLVIQAMEE